MCILWRYSTRYQIFYNVFRINICIYINQLKYFSLFKSRINICIYINHLKYFSLLKEINKLKNASVLFLGEKHNSVRSCPNQHPILRARRRFSPQNISRMREMNLVRLTLKKLLSRCLENSNLNDFPLYYVDTRQLSAESSKL